MMNKRERKSARQKLFLHFLCPCLATIKQSDVILANEQNYALVDEKDKYEYVVEKLAIKKIPLSIFGTEDDYRSVDVSGDRNFDEKRHKTNKLFGGQHETNAHSYYVETRHRYRSNSPQFDATATPSTASLADDVRSLKKKATTKRAGNVDEISNILNKYSSLYTLDDKQKVPKDPLTLMQQQTVDRQPHHHQQHQHPHHHQHAQHSPTCPTMLKPVVMQRLPKRPHFPACTHERHTVEIREPPQRETVPIQQHWPVPQMPGAMTHQMRRTINALGAAQPLTRRLIPRNNRTVSPAVKNDAIEPESEEIRCVPYEDKIKPIFHHKTQTVSRRTQAGDGNSGSKQVPVKKVDEVPSSKEISPNISAKSSNTNDHYVLLSSMSYQSVAEWFQMLNRSTNFSSLFQLPKVIEGDAKCVTKLPSDFSTVERRATASNAMSEHSYTTINKEATSKLNGDDPIMEINHIKGKNLKWKIIIKHHDDKLRK